MNGETTVSYLKKYIFRTVLLIIFAVLLIIFITNIILSGWIDHSILRSLGYLSKSIRNIRKGNLDTPLPYNVAGGNEIAQVCRDFDEMRKYLKETALEKAENEEKREK